MDVPEELRYTADHEWVRLEGGRARIGITAFAEEALGDVVFVSLPALGTELERGAVLGEIESTKAVSEVYAPLAGTVVERNDALVASPSQLNDDPYGAGWVCVLEVAPGEADQASLLGAEEYRALTTS